VSNLELYYKQSLVYKHLFSLISDSEGEDETVTSDLVWKFTSDTPNKWKGVDNFNPVDTEKYIVSTLPFINPVGVFCLVLIMFCARM